LSYLVLARKYRPQSFDDVVGQGAVVHTLKRAIETERIHHAFLFTGSRGVGKTTIARLLAKCLSCESEITANPCGVCSACTGITEGNWVDVMEIDGASNTSVDDVRNLRESARYQPSASRFKIFIIDEVHMLSKSAFNALLKTLEEPPPHVKFVFATTEPHKIPITILSRCQRYDFGRISKNEILERMQAVLAKESLTVDPAGLGLIADAADGGMRDALSLLDQVLSFAGGEATEAQVAAALGLVDRSQVIALADAILNKDAKNTLLQINDVYQRGIDLRQVMQGLATEMRHLAVSKSTGSLEGLVDMAVDIRAETEARAAAWELKDLQRLFAMALAGVDQLARAEDSKLTLELIALKMVERPPWTEMVAISQAMSRLEALAKGKKPDFAILTDGESPRTPTRITAPIAPSADPIQDAPDAVVTAATIEPAVLEEEPPELSEATVVPEPIPATSVSAEPIEAIDGTEEDETDEPEPIDADELMLENMPLENVEDNWIAFVDQVRQSDRTLAAHMEHAYFGDDSNFQNGKIGLVFKKKLHLSAVSQGQSASFFLHALKEHMGDGAEIQLSYQPEFQETKPSIQMARRRALEKAHAALRSYAQEDPVVQKALSLFGGEIRNVERLI